MINEDGNNDNGQDGDVEQNDDDGDGKITLLF